MLPTKVVGNQSSWQNGQGAYFSFPSKALPPSLLQMNQGAGPPLLVYLQGWQVSIRKMLSQAQLIRQCSVTPPPLTSQYEGYLLHLRQLQKVCQISIVSCPTWSCKKSWWLYSNLLNYSNNGQKKPAASSWVHVSHVIVSYKKGMPTWQGT